MKGWMGMVLLLVFWVAAVPAVEVQPGDLVRLQERERHIPAASRAGEYAGPPPLREWLPGDGAGSRRADRVGGSPRRDPSRRAEYRLDYAPVHCPTSRGGRQAPSVFGVVSTSRIATAPSQWSAAARHLESGESPCPGRAIDLYRRRSVPRVCMLRIVVCEGNMRERMSRHPWHNRHRKKHRMLPKAALLRVHIRSAHESDVVGV
jgi:hypothetical protein